MQNSAPDIISITSSEALQNLQTLAHNHWNELCKLPLIVNSERTAKQAQSMGFEQPAMIAVSAGDEGQLEQVKCWLSKR